MTASCAVTLTSISRRNWATGEDFERAENAYCRHLSGQAGSPVPATYAAMASAARTRMLAAIRRIVIAECQASGSPRDPDFETFDSFPLTDNDDATTRRVAAAFSAHFGDSAAELSQQTASEDFSDIPRAGASRTPTGVSAVPIRRPTGPPRRPGASKTTFPSIIPQVPARAAADPAHRYRDPDRSRHGLAHHGTGDLNSTVATWHSGRHGPIPASMTLDLSGTFAFALNGSITGWRPPG